MNILVISRGMPTPKDPQWGCFEYDQAKALSKLGHNVILASVDSRFRLRWRNWGLTMKEIETVHYYNFFLCPGAISGLFGYGFKNTLKTWQWNLIVKKIIQDEGPIDVIYAHYLFNSYFAVNALKQLKAPIVAIEHWSELNKDPLSNNILKMANDTYPYVQRAITVSTPLRNRLKQLFNIDPKVVYNMVGDEFLYTPTSLSNKVRYVTTGSLVFRKGFDMFAKALSILNLPKDKWELNIIGEGEEHQNLQNQIEQCGFTENIHLVGSKSKDEIAKMLNESNVFVLPSRNENFSVAVLEALACGLPVIASICGGIRECIDEKNGLLFEVDDVEGLSKAINHMFYHYQDYDRQAIADDCKARFSSEVIAKQLTQIFEDVINKRSQ